MYDYNDLLKQIVPKKDGLILQAGGYQGTFLPQVWEKIPEVELFLSPLLRGYFDILPGPSSIYSI